MSFIEMVGERIIANTVLKPRKEVASFNILDAWIFLAEHAKEYSNIDYCVVDIAREGDHYLIRIVVFTADGCPIYINGKNVIGTTIKAYNLNRNVTNFMQGEQNQRIRININQLLKNTEFDDIAIFDE